MCEKWIPDFDFTSLPEMCSNCADDTRAPYAAFVRNHGVADADMHVVINNAVQLSGMGRGASSSAAGASAGPGSDRELQQPDPEAGEGTGPRQKRQEHRETVSGFQSGDGRLLERP
eukprot:3179743-Pyramimonas_sp.AAC.1